MSYAVMSDLDDAESRHAEQHKKNASVELPAQVFAEAIRLAETVDFSPGCQFLEGATKTLGVYEQHPALLLLSQWWERNRVDGRSMKCGYAMPWVRAGNGRYQCGYHQTPNESMALFERWAPSIARVGNQVIVEFYATQTIDMFDEHDGLVIYHADGQAVGNVGVSREAFESGGHDEAWYSLLALAAFRQRFPSAYVGIALDAAQHGFSG